MSIETNVQTNDTPRRDDDLGTPPQSRIESDLMNEPVKPQSRIEKLLYNGFIPVGTKFAVNLHGEMNSTTYVLTLYLVDQNGTMYEVDMSVSDGTTATTTPIYIGDDPLEKDEYVPGTPNPRRYNYRGLRGAERGGAE